MNKHYRTTTAFEKQILTWMKDHTNKISTTKVSEKFCITKEDAIRMIEWFNLNPDSDFKKIQTK